MRLPLLCLVAAAIQLYGAPEGCHPVVGDVLYTGEGGDLRVESHGDAIVDWDTFSIGEQERLYFAQDSPSSAILNRVVGGVRSDLYGSLESNGKVFLVNPMGIFIGPNASIDTASFLASTLDILDQDFLERQELLLSGESEGAIIHLGAIRCWEGDAVLCARKVTTQGKIETPAGSACIGAGGVEWLYRPHAAERLFVRARARAREEPPLAAEGEIAGQGVYLASSNPEGPAIACSAEIRGGGAGGEIYIVSDGETRISGRIYSAAGRAIALGERVVITSTARIDLSAEGDGGELWVGTSRKGGAARIAVVERGAEISVRSRLCGRGGQVTIWGEQAASFEGQIDGRGGEREGDGGFVEVSGAWVAVPGRADLRATHGKPGTFFIDPTDITISSGATTGGVNLATDPVTLPASTPVNINNSDLATQLGLSNVRIATASAQAAQGTITISDNVVWGTNTTLTLEADNQLLVSGATISNTDAINMGFTAMDFFAAGNGSGVSGVIRITGTLSTVNGDIILENASGVSGNIQGIYLPGGSISSSGSGNISLTGVGGGSGAAEAVLLETASISASDTGSITLTGTGGTAVSACRGVTIYNGSTVSSVDGDITINGTGGGQAGGGFNEGCTMELNGTVETTGNGSIVFNCTSSQGFVAQSGLRTVSNSHIRSTSAMTPGSITISGTAAYSNNPYPNNQNLGVVIETDCSVAVTNGNAPTTVTAILTSNDSNSLLLYNGGGPGQGGEIGSGTTTGNITVNANSIVLQGDIASTGALVIQPTTDSTTIGIGAGASGTLEFPPAYLAFLINGFSSITIGSATGSGAVDVQATTFTDPITIRSPSGSITVNGQLATSAATDSITLQGGTITLNSGLRSNSGTITLTGPVTLGATTSVDATDAGGSPSGADISFSSTINATSAGSQALTLLAGTGGAVTFSGAIGGATRLGGLTVTSAKTTANGFVAQFGRSNIAA